MLAEGSRMGLVNRSAPPGEVVPGLYYDDVEAAIDWLCGAFGFTERYRYGPEDHTVGAFLAIGESSVALSEARVGQTPDWDHNGELRPPRGDFATGGVSVRVTDVDAHYDRATAFGARTFGPPTTYRFGERQYTAEDLAGHRWSFTQSVADIAPEDWGARLPS
jgi:uncharacterized glyoxalase superfamily protein PhnB